MKGLGFLAGSERGSVEVLCGFYCLGWGFWELVFQSLGFRSLELFSLGVSGFGVFGFGVVGFTGSC